MYSLSSGWWVDGEKVERSGGHGDRAAGNSLASNGNRYKKLALTG